MTDGRKVKVSLTLSDDLLGLVDRTASRAGETRSGVVERWLRRAASAEAERAIEAATVAYYAGLRGPDRAEDAAIARAAHRAARTLAYDGPRVRTRRRRPRG